MRLISSDSSPTASAATATPGVKNVNKVPPLKIQAAVNLTRLRTGTPRTPHTPHVGFYHPSVINDHSRIITTTAHAGEATLLGLGVAGDHAPLLATPLAAAFTYSLNDNSEWTTAAAAPSPRFLAAQQQRQPFPMFISGSRIGYIYTPRGLSAATSGSKASCGSTVLIPPSAGSVSASTTFFPHSPHIPSPYSATTQPPFLSSTNCPTYPAAHVPPLAPVACYPSVDPPTGEPVAAPLNACPAAEVAAVAEQQRWTNRTDDAPLAAGVGGKSCTSRSGAAAGDESDRNSHHHGWVRLFIGRIPRFLGSAELKALFEKKQVTVRDCNIIRDRKSHQSRGCGFLRVPSVEDAQRAISCFNQKVVLDPDLGPLQVKFAEGELERLGLSIELQPGGECVKVFIGNLSPTTTVDGMHALMRLFDEYEDVCVLKDKNKKSKCSGFVTFKSMRAAQNCINALNGKLAFPDCIRPLEVRLAESRSQRGLKKQQPPPPPPHGASCVQAEGVSQSHQQQRHPESGG